MSQEDAVGKAVGTARSSQVPDQFYGFSLQETRFAQLLMTEAPEALIGLEVLDDVSSVLADGSLLVQSKSANSTNPISDRAVDLWKTLANWRRACDDNVNASQTIFELYLGRSRDGNIARLFSSASNASDAKDALNQARDILWGPAPHFPDRADISESISDFVDTFLEPDDIISTTIVERFRLHCSDDPTFDLKELLRSKYIADETIDDVLTHALGWIKLRIDEAMRERRPSVIRVADFTRELTDYYRRYSFRNVLTAIAFEPTSQEIEFHLLRPFVQQLTIIDLGEEDVLEAVIDFLRASVTRSAWAEAGTVHEKSFSEFSDTLISHWKNRRKQIAISHKNVSPAEAGQLLLLQCCELRAALQGSEVPPFFTPGSFHALSDGYHVGWHSQFEKMLKPKNNE